MNSINLREVCWLKQQTHGLSSFAKKFHWDASRVVWRSNNFGQTCIQLWSRFEAHQPHTRALRVRHCHQSASSPARVGLTRRTRPTLRIYCSRLKPDFYFPLRVLFELDPTFTGLLVLPYKIILSHEVHSSYFGAQLLRTLFAW